MDEIQSNPNEYPLLREPALCNEDFPYLKTLLWTDYIEEHCSME